MPVEVTSRHMNATDAIQDYARRRGAALAEEFTRVEHVHIILDVEKHRQIASVMVQGRNRLRLETREDSENMKTSVDLAMDKVERQLRKEKEKVRDHKSAMRQEEEDRAKSL